jgi:hypothetical protein
MVEHIFAIGMGLEIERRRGSQPAAAILDQQMAGKPAAAAADGAALLQRGQEIMGEEGVVPAGAGIPLGRGNIGDPAEQPRLDPFAVICQGRSGCPLEISSGSKDGISEASRQPRSASLRP